MAISTNKKQPMFHSLKTTLKQSLKKNQLESSTQSYLICRQGEKIIQKILNKKNQAQCLYLKNNTLTIQTESAIIASELKLYELKIKQKIKKKFPKAHIKKIKFITH